MMPFRFYEFIGFSEEIDAAIFRIIQRKIMKTGLFLPALILRKVSFIVNFTPASYCGRTAFHVFLSAIKFPLMAHSSTCVHLVEAQLAEIAVTSVLRRYKFVVAVTKYVREQWYESC
jgi:hypothetical protein